MEIKKKVDAPAEFIYEKVVNSSQFDIRKSTGKTISTKGLQGFEYVKQFNKHQSAKIKIVEVKENELYSFSTSTTMNSFLTTYKMEPINNEKCIVTVTEKKENHGGTIRRANDMLMEIALGWLKKRQIKTMITAMGKEYSGVNA
jgi:lysyl-tRNA synthetase class I